MKTHHWFLVIAVVVIGYVLLRGTEQQFTGRRVSYDYDRLAVSQGLTPQAQALDLADQLDVALLPELGKQVIRDAAQQGLREQAFLEYVIREISNRVREISTIDLNADGTVDPVLVKPEPQEGEQFVLLSLRVPAPEAYPLPAARDEAAWKKVETLEVATMTVALDAEQLTVQASGNQHLYPGSAGQHYVAHDRTPSFLQMYLTMRMVDWMFFPRTYGFYGPGFGYGGYRAVPVATTRSARAGTVSSRGYSPAGAAGRSAVRTSSGGTPTSAYARAYPKQPPRSLSQLRSSARFRQPTRAARAGGFGRAADRGGSSRYTRSSTSRAGGFSRATRSTRSTGGFGRGFGRSAFGGGGMRFGK